MALGSVLEDIHELVVPVSTSLSKNYSFQPQNCVVKGYKERIIQDWKKEISILVSSFVFCIKFPIVFSMGDRK